MPQRPAFTEELSREYAECFARAAIRPERAGEVRATVDRIFRPRAMERYRAVAAATGVPAHVVGILHALEAGLDFTRHLHNGDPLTGRTVRVPAGRPAEGSPPFEWAESAADALRFKRLDRWDDWSVPGIAYVLERYNGFGYRNREPRIASPYLWSGTTLYTSGKYVADHVFDPTATSRQCGGLALLREMLDSGRVEVPGGTGAV